LEVGGRTGDAEAAHAAVKLEREKLLKELRRARFHGPRTKRPLSRAKAKSKSKPFARHTEHFPFASAIADRKSGNRASGVEFAVFLTVVNLRPRDFVVRSLDDSAFRIRISRSSIEV
jgi:hypothetical protein